jgi:methionyl-tRNA formyltransferase
VDHVYNLIRGCNPAPGAWTTVGGRKLEIHDARKHPFRRFADVSGKVGEITDVTDQSFKVTAQGGRVEVLRARAPDGKKLGAGEVARALGLAAGTILGAAPS